MYKLHIELLEKSKEYLWDGVGIPPDGYEAEWYTAYICFAVAEACEVFEADSVVTGCLKNDVLSKMPGSTSYTSYLRQMAAAGAGRRLKT